MVRLTYILLTIICIACSNNDNLREQEHYIKSLHERIFDVVQYHDRTVQLLEKEHEGGMYKQMLQVRQKLLTDTKQINLDSLLFELNIPANYNKVILYDRKGERLNQSTTINSSLSGFNSQSEFKRFVKNGMNKEKHRITPYMIDPGSMNLYKIGYVLSNDSSVMIQLISTSRSIVEERDFLQNKLESIVLKEPWIEEITLFEKLDSSLVSYYDSSTVSNQHQKMCEEILLYKGSIIRDQNSAEGYTDSEVIQEKEEGSVRNIMYSYVHRDNNFGLRNTLLRVVWKQQD